MKKAFKLKNLECANCAEKMRRDIAKIDGVQSVSVNFMSQKLSLEADEARFDAILDEVKKAIRRVEPGCTVMN